MANAIRFEGRLGGGDEFSTWKFRIQMILKENKVDSFFQTKNDQPETELDKTTWIEGMKRQ